MKERSKERSMLLAHAWVRKDREASDAMEALLKTAQKNERRELAGRSRRQLAARWRKG